MRRILFGCLILAAMPFAAVPAFANCSENQVELRGDWGSARFRVAIADEVHERAQGLMRVPELPRLGGMLFIYDHPQRVSFWMENTLIPLDMIFADETGLVVNVHTDAVPMDRTPIPGGSDDILYVLEVNAGTAETFGIGPGTQLRHASVAQEIAVWPCSE